MVKVSRLWHARFSSSIAAAAVAVASRAHRFETGRAANVLLLMMGSPRPNVDDEFLKASCPNDRRLSVGRSVQTPVSQ